MNCMDIQTLIDNLKLYIKDEKQIEIIYNAYFYAENLHKGQKRQSGEDYIVHPLSVAFILSEMHADVETIVAALLHDVVEDTKTPLEEIEERFGCEVAKLVDGVTKIDKLKFTNDDEKIAANTRKIITSMMADVRVINIKLADRLHNMRTLQYKSKEERRSTSYYTMDIYVPIAYRIGAYKIMNELEDFALRYIEPDIYNDITQKRNSIQEKSQEIFKEIIATLSCELNKEGISHVIESRIKNVYGIYKNLGLNQEIVNIHDLRAIKIMVETVKECYDALRIVHSKYKPLHSKFKDYIAQPKTNLYRSLHTTVFGPDASLFHGQIRTYEMNKIAEYGLLAYWGLYNSREKMQQDLKAELQFYDSIAEINAGTSDNKEFLRQVKEEIFTSNVYVYTANGDIIELPVGSTPIDFAYRIHTDIGNTMTGAIVNGDSVPVNYALQNKDIVRIVTGSLAYGSKGNWVDMAHTSHAKRKIREFNGKIS